MKKNMYLSIYLCFINILFVSAQQNVLLDKKSAFAKKYEPEVNDDGWIYFSKKPPIKEFVANLLQTKSSFGLNGEDMLITKGKTPLLKYVSEKNKIGDENGALVIDQTHGNVPVELAQFAIHCDDAGNVKLMHGKLIKNLPPLSRNIISETVALQNVLSSIRSSKYA